MSTDHTLSPFERSPLEIRQRIYSMIEEDRVVRVKCNGPRDVFLAPNHRDKQRETMNAYSIVTLSKVSRTLNLDMNRYKSPDHRGLAAVIHHSLVVFANGVDMREFANRNTVAARRIESSCLADFYHDNPVLLMTISPDAFMDKKRQEETMAFWRRYPAISKVHLIIDPLPLQDIHAVEAWLDHWCKEGRVESRPSSKHTPELEVALRTRGRIVTVSDLLWEELAVGLMKPGHDTTMHPMHLLATLLQTRQQLENRIGASRMPAELLLPVSARGTSAPPSRREVTLFMDALAMLGSPWEFMNL